MTSHSRRSLHACLPGEAPERLKGDPHRHRRDQDGRRAHRGDRRGKSRDPEAGHGAGSWADHGDRVRGHAGHLKHQLSSPAGSSLRSRSSSPSSGTRALGRRKCFDAALAIDVATVISESWRLACVPVQIKSRSNARRFPSVDSEGPATTFQSSVQRVHRRVGSKGPALFGCFSAFCNAAASRDPSAAIPSEKLAVCSLLTVARHILLAGLFPRVYPFCRRETLGRRPQ